MGQEVSPDSISEQPREGKYLLGVGDCGAAAEEQRRHVYTELHKERRILYYL